MDEHNYQRSCAYLLSVSNYAASSEERVRILKTCVDIFLKQKAHSEGSPDEVGLTPLGNCFKHMNRSKRGGNSNAYWCHCVRRFTARDKL